MSISDLLLQLLHEILIVLAVVVVASVRQRGVDQSGEHVDDRREQVATTKTVEKLLFIDLPGVV